MLLFRFHEERSQLLPTHPRGGAAPRHPDPDWASRTPLDRPGAGRAGGVSVVTLRKIERGDTSVGLGVTFEAATLTGVPLFYEERSRLATELGRAGDRLAVLPSRARKPREIDDDF
jgi:hypothetical protein